MGHTDFSDHQEQGTPARYAFHHRVRLSDTCGKHAWTEAAAVKPQMAAHLNREVVGTHAEPEYPVQSAIADGDIPTSH